MKTKKILNSFGLLSLVILMLSCSSPGTDYLEPEAFWPEVSTSMKPWTRWWWMGNAVDKENITTRLEEMAYAGLGGVEITPIFGVKGAEDRFLQYISPQWMEMLIHTLDEAERLGMEVDMVQGTGWPFGGPQVEKEYAAGKIFIQKYQTEAGETFKQKIVIDDPEQLELADLQFVFAFDDEGNKTDLSSMIDGGMLVWTPESGHVIYAIFNGKTNQQVKRSAPGGEGFVLDHFSREAIADYLKPYEETLGPVKNRLRALFNDSYEVYNADYTPRFFEEFRDRRGYDFTDHIHSLAGDTSSAEALRILADYRETLSDLVLEDMSENWVRWANENTFKAKYQAHGAPGNLIDIYATADIPECESFYATEFDIPGLRREESDAREAYPDLILLKFASSAANISGKPLTSSETLTWLREHFKTALSQCKPEIEQLLLSGVNHIFFHGSTYYPDDAEWPGWKFYASVNFVPAYTIWKDAPYMFDYITRCQSLLQSGVSDNEILVYWPFHDVIADDMNAQLIRQLGINNKDEWLVHTSFHKLVSELMDRGYSVDFVTDRFLAETDVKDGKINTPGLDYEALVIPDAYHMPVATMENLIRLNESGGRIVFEGLPETVPGYHTHTRRADNLQSLITKSKDDLIVTGDVHTALEKIGLRGEGLKDEGLDFIRREVEDGKIYYLVNHTPDEIDEFITIGTAAKSVIIMDPLTGNAGQASIKPGKSETRVLLQMKPGEAVFLRTSEREVGTVDWQYIMKEGDPVNITGEWALEFQDGGPAVPAENCLQELISWTVLGDEAEAFSGTALYSIEFDNPDPGVESWQLDLGDVRESARISVNGEEMGCLWSVPFSIDIGALDEGENSLEIEVTNLSANRLRDLEMRGIEWKIFYEINLVNRHYETFDATTWDPMPSGLLGPVTLTPTSKFRK